MNSEHEHQLLHAGLDAIKALTEAIKSLNSNHEPKTILTRIERKVDQMAKTQSELAADVKAATEQLKKIGTETSATLQKVTDLQAIIDAGGGVGSTVSQELIDAVDALKAQAQVVDDLVPDAAPPAPPAPPA